MRLKKIKIIDIVQRYSTEVTGLFPIDDFEEYKKIKEGEEINVKWDKARNVDHHRKFFKILQKVIDATGIAGSVEELLLILKYEIGYVKKIKTLDGQERIIPASINFDKCGQKKFEKFYNLSLAVLSRHTGITKEEMEL